MKRKAKKQQYKTKRQRQKWWKSLSPEQQQEYIEKKQAQKAKKRIGQLPRILTYNFKYPWMIEGVNETNREQWLAMIHEKNPWLKVG